MRSRKITFRIKLSKSITKDNGGATALEFAFIAPVMLLLMMGIIEFSMIMFTQTVMESATSNTSRMGRTGFSLAGLSREQQLINNVATRTAGLLNPSLITVTMQTYSSFDRVNDPEPFIDSNNNGVYNSGEAYTDINGNGQWDQDMATAGAGNANDIVVYTVSYPWQITTPLVNAVIGNIFAVSARSVVKNEPY